MTHVCESIYEQRIALEELNLIRSQIRTQYGGNPPVEVLTTMAELAGLYRQRFACGENMPKQYFEFETFCVNNRLHPVPALKRTNKISVMLNWFCRCSFINHCQVFYLLNLHSLIPIL